MTWRQQITLTGAVAGTGIADQESLPVTLDSDRPRGLLIHGAHERPGGGSISGTNLHGMVETALVASVGEEPTTDSLRLAEGRMVMGKVGSNDGAQSMVYESNYHMLRGRVVVAEHLGMRYQRSNMAVIDDHSLTLDVEVVDLDFDTQLAMWNVVEEGSGRDAYRWIQEEDLGRAR